MKLIEAIANNKEWEFLKENHPDFLKAFKFKEKRKDMADTFGIGANMLYMGDWEVYDLSELKSDRKFDSDDKIYMLLGVLYKSVIGAAVYSTDEYSLILLPYAKSLID